MSTTSVRSDSFEASAAAKVAQTHPDADLLALRASFNLVRLSTLHMHRLESEVHRDAGWSMAGFRVMFCVWVAQELEPREIARFSGLSRAAVSSVLNTLERDGLVERHRESTDRRLVTVRLTGEGERRLVAAYGNENSVERAFFAPLGESELDTFVVLLRRLLRQRSE
ncbi:MAG: MarR family transcriptional regulator [Actinomycetales bacterium]|nr:MarR family transcriptional regulator [Candidatus Phosphoribacter baldrii]MBK6956696.1 MarR family transcriptional regulator [Candidatus Phosphoribacter baldrii]MBK7611469.1 MarR family transcriptional regulator [Candidatus Phosphoribacter baldrii]